MLIRELGHACPLRRMFDGDGTDVPLTVDVQERILVKVARLDDGSLAELDVERNSFSEVADFHGSNPLSKKAL